MGLDMTREEFVTWFWAAFWKNAQIEFQQSEKRNKAYFSIQGSIMDCTIILFSADATIMYLWQGSSERPKDFSDKVVTI